MLKRFIMAASLLLVISCQSKKSVKTLKLAHGLDKTHPVHIAMEYMAERLKEKSGGTMDIEIYTNQQLGSERECLELLQVGGVAITKVSAAVLENFVPKYKVLGLPYIFKNKQHQFRVLDGALGKEILSSSDKFWLHGLGFYDSGSRSFYTKEKPVNQPSDLKGLKIRTMESPTAMEMVSSMGGSPTPISFGELYTALQAGIVDGAENNPPSFYLTRHYEVCKYYTIDEHSSIPDVLLIGKIAWEGLNETQKQWLSEAVKESITYQRKLWDTSEKDCLEQLEKAGVQITYPDKSPFANSVEKMYKQFESDPELHKLITKIKNLD